MTTRQYARDAQHHMDYADAAIALVKGEQPDIRERVLLRRVASGSLSADAAVQITAARFGATVSDRADAAITEFDDYLIPGSLTLRNRFETPAGPHGVEDPELFRRLEREISRIRLVEISQRPVVGALDFDHMKAIHRRLFGDIYSWAGEQRVGPDSPMIRFAPDAVNFEPGDVDAPMIKYTYFAGPDIDEAASVVYAQLADLVRRRDMPRQEVLDIMAELAGEIQTIHAFRDGNSRTVYVFAMQFFERLGYSADPGSFLDGSALKERMIHARYQNHATGQHEAYFRVFDTLLSTERATV